MFNDCMNCDHREVGCHSKCESYMAFRKERDAINEKKVAEYKMVGDLVRRSRSRGYEWRQKGYTKSGKGKEA